MASLWKNYNSEYEKYERDHPLSFPWSRRGREDAPRYVRGEDGYWFDPSAKESGKALISCTGDLMCEPRMTNAHRYGDAYFFHPLFKFVRGILKGSDFSVGNLETTLSDATPYAGEYHRIDRQFHCNAPACYLDAVRYAGFDALVTANNHTCDSGVTGIFDTLGALDDGGFMHTGTYRGDGGERVLFVKINGIRCAIISYASRYNSHDERNFTKEGIDSILNYYSKERIDKDTAYARERGAEFILCYIHWGKDYDLVPGEKQLSVLETLRDADVDYIVGSHTHCLQANAKAKSTDGREIPMMYSMGNFVTNEPKELCKHTGILQLILERKGGAVSVREYFIPCYVYDEFHSASFAVVPTDPMLNGGYNTEKMTRVNEYVRERVGESMEFLPSAVSSLGEICDAMGASLAEEDRGIAVTKLCCEVGPSCRGALYFSYGGEAGYATRELTRRELCAIVAEKPIDGFKCIIVPDVREAFVRACEAVSRHANPARRILVAGGEGKTLARELISDALKTSYGVLDIKDGYDVDVTPWQNIHPYHDFCLMELRSENPLGARAVARSMNPDTCVITSFVEDVSDIVASIKDGGLLVVNGADAHLVSAMEKINTDRLIVAFFGDDISSENLPFSDMRASASAALKLSLLLGLPEGEVVSAIKAHELTDHTHNVISIDGIELLLALNAKSERIALGAVEAFAEKKGRKIAILGATEDGADLDAIAGAAALGGTEYIFTSLKYSGGKPLSVDGVTVVTATNERELEISVLNVLREGDNVLICGSRSSGISIIARRLFGVTDGYISNSEYWTTDSKLDY